jgi:hypothetical protein
VEGTGKPSKINVTRGAGGVHMSSSRRIALIAGVLFLITFITAIAAVYLFQPVLDDPGGDIAGAGADKRIFLGAFLELLLIIANLGTAVVPKAAAGVA